MGDQGEGGEVGRVGDLEGADQGGEALSTEAKRFTIDAHLQKQEQTKFYDPRRGITKDFQRLRKLKKDVGIITTKNLYYGILSVFAFLTFLILKMTLKFRFDLTRPT